MARLKNKLPYISVPAQIIASLSSSSLQNILLYPQIRSKTSFRSFFSNPRNPNLWFFLLFLSFLGMVSIFLLPLPSFPSPSPYVPCSILLSRSPISTSNSILDAPSPADSIDDDDDDDYDGDGKDAEFWKQPDGMGYRPCLNFSKKYREKSQVVAVEKTKYLMVVVSGGLNQQRNQIIDAVVFARILGAALVVPVLEVNAVWGDESEFSDIFDLEHFKKTLANDVHVVSSLPPTHLLSRPVKGNCDLLVTPQWIRKRYLNKLNRDGVLLLRGFDSRLTKDLPSDLQKLRCKVTFQALKFSAPIQELGNKLADRMRSKGPYMALHLRMEMDVWVRTGCLPGLGREYDKIIHKERQVRPELLTSRSNMSYHSRKLAGLCPLNALEVTRLLKALGAPRSMRIYWAGGNPFGGQKALLPLLKEFPHFYNKENLSLPGELEPFSKKASTLAAIDYMVAANSDVFMASHGGNMGRTIKGHRAFNGHRKHITPNKRQMLSYFLNSSLPESEFNSIIKNLHHGSLGQPEIRTIKPGRDVIAYPVPECMCNVSRNTLGQSS